MSTSTYHEKELRSIQAEFGNFITHQALTPAMRGELQKAKSKALNTSMSDGLCEEAAVTKCQETNIDDTWKLKSRLVMCGNFNKNSHKGISITNMDAPLLRLLLSQTASPTIALTSVDTTSAYLTTDIEDNCIILATPSILVKKAVLEPGTVWRVRKAAYGLR